MEKNNCRLDAVKLDKPMLRLGLRLEPEQDGAVVSPAQEGMTLKEFQRQVSVLKGYLSMAAANRKEAVLCLRETDVPVREGPEALLAVWYDRAVQSGSTHNRLMAYYNAFGALPGGFAAVEGNMERWLGQELAQKLLNYVQAARREDGELAEDYEPCPPAIPWEAGELDALDEGVRRAGRAGF